MLKGWVLTDNACPECSIPMMRSPLGVTPAVEFCVNCKDDMSQPPPSEHQSPTSITSLNASTSPSLAISSISTPLTEVSSTLSSPILAPLVDTEEILRRRRQSDMASAELGNRLLKGWAMLADSCPNTSCYGVPLVRPPMSGSGKDPRKECVICQTVYVSDKDVNGLDHLVPFEPPNQPSLSGSNPLPTGPSINHLLKDRGKSTPFAPARVLNSQEHAILPDPVRDSLWNLQPDKRSSLLDSTTMAALEASSRSLELTLHALSEKLNFLTSGQMPFDPVSISQIAETVSKVSLALSQVKQLQRSEFLAHPSQ